MSTAHNVPHDFSLEFARCDELERTCEDTPYWNMLCDDWADEVRKKLASWNPRMARKFLTVNLFESSGGVYMLDESPELNTKLSELRQRRRRLEMITCQRRWFHWLLILVQT